MARKKIPDINFDDALLGDSAESVPARKPAGEQGDKPVSPPSSKRTSAKAAKASSVQDGKPASTPVRKPSTPKPIKAESVQKRKAGTRSGKRASTKGRKAESAPSVNTELPKVKQTFHLTGEADIALRQLPMRIRMLTGMRGHSVSMSRILACAIDMFVEDVDVNGADGEAIQRLIAASQE